MVDGWIAGDIPIYLKFALKVTTPLENVNFDRFRLIVHQPRELTKKVQSSLIGSRQYVFHRAIDKPCALAYKLPKGWLKTRIFTYFCVAFHIFVAGNRRHFKFVMPIDHNKSQLRTTNYP